MILEKCNSSGGQPSDYNYISEFQEKFIFLRWHVCRVNFARKIFFRATNFLTKNAPKNSPKCLSLCSVGQKNPGKIPPNFPLNFPNFPAKNQKKITDELLQERRKNILLGLHLQLHVFNLSGGLWPCWPHRTPKTPKELKWLKSDSEATGRPQSNPESAPKSDQKMTKNSLLSHFLLGGRPVASESLFSDFNCFVVLGFLWGQQGHKPDLNCCRTTSPQALACLNDLSIIQFRGSSFAYTWSSFCLQLSFFAYSLSMCLLDALSHCKQKTQL